MDLPRILITSTMSGKAEEIAKRLGSKHLLTEDEIEYYIWDIDNKYYKAQVLLCATENPLIKIDREGIEALIVHYNAQSERGTNELDEWMPLISSLSEAEVQILACDSVLVAPSKDQAMEWCTQYKFELVELQRSGPEECLDDPDDDNEKFGIDRVIEALHSHTWPNMELKGGLPSMGNTSTDVNGVNEQLEGIQLNDVHDISQSLQMDDVLEGIMGGENADFGELFGHLMAMKEHAASLPVNQRRAAAEQLVTAFWKAMGGDPDEIDGLDQ